MPSRTITKRTGSGERTGTQPSVTGAALPPPALLTRRTYATEIRWPPYLTQIVNAHAVRWIDWLSQTDKTQALTEREHASATQYLCLAIGELEANTKPMPPEKIIDGLEKMASVFSAPLPDGDGLILYVGALQDLGRCALYEGMRTCIKTHKWPRLPFPAEILEAGKDAQLWCELMLNRAKRCQVDLALIPVQ